MILSPKGSKDVFQALGMVGSFGFLVGGATFGGYIVGSYLDGYFGTAPWLLLTFVLLAIVASFMEFFQIVKRTVNKKR